MAGVYKGLTIKIGADTTGLSDALNRIDSQARGLTREMKAIDKAMKLDPKNTELARQKMEAYEKEIKATSERLKTLQDAQQNGDFSNVENETAARAALQREISVTQGKLEQLTSSYKDFAIQQKAAESGIGKAGQALTDLHEKIAPVADAMDSAGKKMSAAITAPAVAAGAASVKIAMDFETSLAKVSTLADTSAMSMEEIGDGARELAVEYGRSASEINEALYQAMSASVDTADSLEFVETATRLSKAGFTESATAVDVLTTAINAYGMEADKAEHVSDVLVNTQNLGKTTVNELASSMGNVIPTAAAYNVNLENLAASYAVMTKQGINTANATTAINGMLTELAEDGSTVNGILQEMSGKTFGQMMADGQSLGDVLEMLMSSVNGDREAFANLWGNMRASKGALAIANAGAEEFNGTLDSMVNASGVVDEALDKLGGTAQGALNKAKASVEDAAISVGQVLLPYVVQAAEAVKGAADAFGSLSKEQQETIVKTAAVAAGIGPVLVLLAKAMNSIGTIGKGLKTLSTAFATVEVESAGAAAGVAATGNAAQGAAKKITMAERAAATAKLAFAGLAIAGIAIVVSKIAELIGEQMKLGRAVSALKDSASAFKSASDVAATGVDSQAAAVDIAAYKFGQYREAALEAADASIDLANNINESFGSAETDAAMAQEYADTILELAGNCNGSAEKVAELKGAIEAYNNLTGSSYAVVDEYSGRINASTEALQANTVAFKENAYAKAASAAYEAAVQHEVELANKIKETNAAREAAEQKMKELEDAGQAQFYDGFQMQDTAEYAKAKAAAIDAGAAIEDMGAQYEEAKQLVDISRQTMGEYAAAADEAAAASERAKLTVDDYRSAFEGLGAAEGQFDEFAANISGDVDSFVQAMQEAGIGTEQLAQIGLDNFMRLMQGADNDMSAVASAIAVVNTLGIDPKYVEVDESGIVSAEGHIVDLQKKTIDGKEFVVSDEGSIELVDDGLGDIEAITIGDKKFDVHVQDYATGEVDNIIRNIENNKKAVIRVEASNATGNAAGGISPAAIRPIPRNAAGGINAIVTQPTLTNVGWVGEDGAEAVFHMRNAGGAIVPLTNRRHVRPFAQAVAAEMGNAQAGGSISVAVTVNAKTDADANEIAMVSARKVKQILMARGR